MKGPQTPCLGLQPTPAQPVPPDSKHPSILNLWEVDSLGPEVFWNRSPRPRPARWPHLVPGPWFVFPVCPHPCSGPAHREDRVQENLSY